MPRARTPEKPPAFQFYAQRWLASTRHFSPEAKGVMVDLMAWSWDNGPLPADEQALARLSGVTVRRFRYLWLVIGQKWQQTDRGYINARLEQCREELQDFLSTQSERGKAGAAARWGRHNGSNGASNAPAIAQAMPDGMLADGSPISDLRSPDREIGDPDNPNAVPHAVNARAHEETALMARSVPVRASGQRPEGLIDGRSQRVHGTHAWCSTRDGLCVPWFLHDEFRGKSQRSDEALKCWYALTVQAFDGQPIGEDSLVFWRNNFGRWIGPVTAAPGHGKADRTLAGAQRVIADIERGAL